MKTSGDEGGRIKNAILIAGPTASGKSALALDFAMRLGGTIVNADSMQVYSVLRVLTARPGADDLARAPHLLYGHVHPSTAYSTGAWIRDVDALRENMRSGEGPMIFVGGTGLYFRALTEGISDMPDIAPAVRERWRGLLAEEGPYKLHRVLAERDPAAAAALRPSDGQRIVRALEVAESSGRSILAWQAEKGRPLVDRASARFLVLEPDRRDLIARIDARFDRMIEDGALDEAAALAALGLDPSLPAMRAIGVPELIGVLRKKLSAPEAVSHAKIATRQYAKRQSTWFRHQLDAQWLRFSDITDAKTAI